MRTDLKGIRDYMAVMPLRLHAVVLITACLMLGTVLYSLYAINHMATVHEPRYRMVCSIALRTSDAHLWFEEIVSGDESRDINRVWNDLDSAEQGARLMLEGGELDGLTLYPVEEKELRVKLGQILTGLEEFKKIAHQRLESSGQGGIGSPLDQHFDVVYLGILDSAESFASHIQSHSDKARQIIFAAQLFLFISTVAAIILSSLALYRFERRRMMDLARVRESESRFKLVSDSGADGIWTYDIDSRRAWWSDRFSTALGYRPGELEPCFETWSSLVHPEDKARTRDALESHLANHTPYDIEYRMKPKRGDYRWFHARGAIQKDETGKAIRTGGSLHDITERKRTEEALRENEDRFRVLFHDAPLAYHSLDKGGIVLDINDTWSNLLGYPRDKVIGANFGDFVEPSCLKHFLYTFSCFLNDGEIHGAEFEMTKANGEALTVEIEGKVKKDKNGVFQQTQCIMTDVTEKRRVQKSLQFAQFAVDKNADITYWAHKDGSIFYANDAACATLGYTLSELASMKVSDIAPDLSAGQWREHWTRLGKAGSLALETSYQEKDGRIFPVEMLSNYLRYEGEEFICAHARDISGRKNAEARLRVYDHIVSATNDMMAFVDTQYVYKAVNDSYANAFGKTPDEVVGRHVWEILGEQDFRKNVKGNFDRSIAGEEVSYTFWIDFPQAGRRFMDVAYYPHRDADGVVVGLVVDAQDITDLVQLQDERQLMWTAIEHAVETIVITDVDAVIEYVNPAFEQLTGYKPSEVVGKRMSILKSGRHGEEFYRELWDTILQGKVWKGSFIDKNSRGDIFEVSTAISPVFDEAGKICHFVEVQHDITRERELEDHLRQAQKMEAIGTLAGGIAHDFNNILQCVIGHAELALYEVENDTLPFQCLKEIRDAGNRARDLVAQISAFSRRSDDIRKPIRLQTVIEEAMKLLRSSIPSTIEIECRLDGDCGPVLADPTQMHQVIMNLCTNASHAMRDGGGSLRIGLAKTDSPPIMSLNNNKGDAVSWARLTVADSGIGIAKEILERIFEPYFTTKERGEGTGMGLSTVHGIVTSHGGTITVDSVLGQGAEFKIYLPLCFQEGEVGSGDVDARPARHVSANIMFVDDEKPITEFAKMTLESVGYHVQTYTSSLEALDTFRERPADFDVVITDLTMPKLTGLNLARKLLEIRPELPIILCTGYATEGIEREIDAAGVRGYIKKPINPSGLLKMIAETLSTDVAQSVS